VLITQTQLSAKAAYSYIPVLLLQV